VITAHEVGISFRFDRQRRVVTRSAARIRRAGPTIWGLRDLSFSLEPGEGVALLGRSGSGKTTLLRLLGGVYSPDAGTLAVRGNVACLLSTDAGLLPLLTGRENALHLSVLAGLTRAQARAALDSIKERSDLGDYFERPVSSFSQGMRARLGLAVQDERNTDILLLDEVHEALDHEFRQKLEERAHDLLAHGGIVVAAGHDHPMLRRLCTRALYLRDGRLQAEGSFDEIQRTYLDELHLEE